MSSQFFSSLRCCSKFSSDTFVLSAGACRLAAPLMANFNEFLFMCHQDKDKKGKEDKKDKKDAKKDAKKDKKDDKKKDKKDDKKKDKKDDKKKDKKDDKKKDKEQKTEKELESGESKHEQQPGCCSDIEDASIHNSGFFLNGNSVEGGSNIIIYGTGILSTYCVVRHFRVLSPHGTFYSVASYL